MGNKKVFIGNLDFEVTEGEVKSLLSKYGTVVNIKMHQTKGYAFVEMSDPAEAAQAVQKLDGIKYGKREIRISLEMKPGKAKTVSVKRYKEQGAIISRERSGRDRGSEPRNEKYKDTLKNKSDNGKRTYRPKDKSSAYVDKSMVETKKLPRPERDRWATERPADLQLPQEKERYREKPGYTKAGSRNAEHENYNKSAGPETYHKTGEKKQGLRNRPPRDYTKESSDSPMPQKRERTSGKPLYQERRPADRERSSSPRPAKKEWSVDKSSGSSRKINDSWKERPEKKEFSGERFKEQVFKNIRIKIGER